MKILALYIILLMLPFVSTANNNTYPYLINTHSLPSGDLITSQFPDSASKIYSIESDFSGTKISVWTFPLPLDKKSINLKDHKVISRKLIDDKLFLCCHNEYILSLLILDQDLDFEIFHLLDLRKSVVKSIDSKIISLLGEELVLLIGTKLFKYNISLSSIREIHQVEDIIDVFLIHENRLGIDAIILSPSNLNTVLSYLRNDDLLPMQNNIITFHNNLLLNKGDKLFIISSDKGVNQTIIHSINLDNFSVENTQWLNTSNELSYYNIEDDGVLHFAYLERQSSMHSLVLGITSNGTNVTEILKTAVPTGFYRPLSFHKSMYHYITVFSNGIVVFDLNGRIVSAVNIDVPFNENQNLNFYSDENRFIISSTNNAILFEMEYNTYWMLKSITNRSKQFIFPVLSLVLMLIFVQLYRHQRRIFREMIDLPGLGFVVFIDKSGNLKMLNRLAEESLKINKAKNKNKFYEQYFLRSPYNQFVDIIKYSFDTRSNSESRMTIEVSNDWREWLCKTIVLRNIAGRFRGVFFTGVDITEQLQKKRLSNWAQIAHDMQTNLSTIKLNAEQIDCDQYPNITKKKERILHQVKLLILRVRDIVTVGRSDNPDFAKHDTMLICDEVLSEFDDTMFPHIKFVNNAKSISFFCDKAKLVRAIRNAVENGIKAIGDNDGNIQLLANKADNKIFLTVKDSGKGMDSDTMRKMNIPYFTTAKNSGGSGIGTMIMQHVAELHHGRIIIHSEIGKGTELTFELPINPSKFIGKIDA